MLNLTEEDGKRISTRFVLLGCLMARSPQRLFVEAYTDTITNLQKAGINYRLITLGGCSDLSYGRNLLAAKFLKSECTDLIWLDDDIAWKSEDIMRLIASEQDVIGGVYRKKLDEYPHDDPLSWCAKPSATLETDRFGARVVDGLGMGFFKTSRRCLETIIKEVPALPMRHDDAGDVDIYRFFHFDGLGRSEDYTFCETWRSLGGKVWADPAVILAHVGEYAYVGDPTGLLDKACRKELA